MRTQLKKAIGQHKEKVETKSLEPQKVISPEVPFVLRPLNEAEMEYFKTQIGVSLNTDKTLKPHSAAEDNAMMVCGNNAVPQVDENAIPSASEQQNQIGVSILNN